MFQIFIPRRSADGFTLIDLLVSILVVAVLSVLLMPAAIKMRNSAAGAKCMSNLRQISAAVHSYTGDNQVYPSCMTLSASYSWDPPYWMDLLKPYLPDAYQDSSGWFNRNKVFYCPAEKTHHPFSDYGPNGVVMYVANNAEPVRPIRVTYPAKTALLMDSRWGTGNQGSFLIDGAFFSNPKQTGLTGSPYPPRHGNTVNVAFCDGHVEPMSFDHLAENRRSLFGLDGL